MSTNTQSAPPVPPSSKEREKRKKKLRSELVLLLKRLRKLCSKFKQVEEWYQHANQLKSILDRYDDVLESEDRQRLLDASKLADATLKAVHAACQLLQLELERVITILPIGMAIGALPWVIGAILTASVAVGAVIGVSNMRSGEVALHIMNAGCPSIPIADALDAGTTSILSTLGIELPDQIGTDQTADWALPALPVSLHIDARDGQNLDFSVLGIRFGFGVSQELTALELDGQPILGNQFSFSLQSGGEHELMIGCK